MKVKEYVKKFNLKKERVFDKNQFIFDLSNDFISHLAWYRRKSTEKLRFDAYWQVVAEIRKKFEGIFNKSPGPYPEDIWKTFINNVVFPTMHKMYPEVGETCLQIDQMNLQSLIQNYFGGIVYSRVEHIDRDSIKKIQQVMRAQNTQTLQGYIRNYACQRFIILAKDKVSADEKRIREERERLHAQYSSHYYQFKQFTFEQLFNDFYNYFGGMFNVNYEDQKPIGSFEILGIDPDSNSVEVKKAYRELAKEHHPDKNGDQKKFIEVTEAYNKCLAYLNN